MSEPRFYKFPRTLHLAGSAIADDDEFVTDEQLSSVLNLGRTSITRVIAQEKVLILFGELLIRIR